MPVIKAFDYLTTLEPIEGEIMAAIRRTLHSGQLILGPETEAFEREFATLVGAKHCIGVTSGTSALHLALLGLGIGPGDEVITVTNTCVPTVAAIQLAGATPVLVDVREEDLMIDPDLVTRAITGRTRCILPVHLWGQGVDIARLMEIADRAGLLVLEDCAQAQGAVIGGQHAGTFGVAGCFSFYPTKNLGAYGDAGAIVTDDDELATRFRRGRMYGYTRSNYAEEPGMNARIAELQAAILRVKLRYLSEWLARRRAIAARYHRELDNRSIQMPHLHDDREHAYHQFVVRCQDRARVIAALEDHAIGYGIHYPTPVHQMPAYRALGGSFPVAERASGEILSIPVHEALTERDVDLIIATLNKAA
jgi:aminotransferase EvaB